MVIGSDMIVIESSLILVPASGRDSEGSITIHHPGESFVILKPVQTLSYRFLAITRQGSNVGIQMSCIPGQYVVCFHKERR
ncbi:hypothetical protein MNBD_NITROSPIRAE02-451 [hydrothermal vent metagenome]|uniref:Uncharacterized protein n=1 Tax=hydrothermal vent metagenome TaxID=652676 RepID=A0A3B1CXX6_9ZZZZ